MPPTKIEITKGQEGHLVITEDIFAEEVYARSAYQKAEQALSDFIVRGKAMREILANSGREQSARLSTDAVRDWVSESLYLFGQNIIAFSGHRGQGKTSAMLSMCGALKKLSEPAGREQSRFCEGIKGCSFSVLQPIDPTCLENAQDILSLILSRMYRHVIDLFARKDSPRYGQGVYEKFTEFRKSEVFLKFQSCLDSINAAKGRTQERWIENMALLDDYSDGAVLKKKFYELIDLVLDLEYGESGRENHFMVIQLDDTDFQIVRGYEIMEDIRKYLTLPNVVFFMATDVSLLRKGIIQHYLKDFETNIKYLGYSNTKSNVDSNRLNGVDEIREIGGKYLAKLIPPAYIAHLPYMNELVRDNGETIQLDYLDHGRHLLPTKERGLPYSLQNAILRYIYQKTHIVFVAPGSYMHNIIPTTLRGIVQLLRLLSDMEDVPEINEEKMNHSNNLIAALSRQIPIQRKNIQLFEDYFLNDWIPAKLTQKDQDRFSMLCDTLPAEFPRVVRELLPQSTDKKEDGSDICYADTIRRIEQERKRCHVQSEFYFCYAICTYMTIEYNKSALREKQRAIEENKKNGKNGSLFVVNYGTEKYSLPTSCGSLNMRQGVFPENEATEISADLKDYLKNSFLDDTIFRIILNLGSLVGENNVCISNSEDNQRLVFLTQEFFIRIATHWDIQHLIYKEFANSHADYSLSDFFKIMSDLQSKLFSINDDQPTNSKKPMICSLESTESDKMIPHMLSVLYPVNISNSQKREETSQISINSILEKVFLERGNDTSTFNRDEAISNIKKLIQSIRGQNQDDKNEEQSLARTATNVLSEEEQEKLSGIDSTDTEQLTAFWSTVLERLEDPTRSVVTQVESRPRDA